MLRLVIWSPKALSPKRTLLSEQNAPTSRFRVLGLRGTKQTGQIYVSPRVHVPNSIYFPKYLYRDYVKAKVYTVRVHW